MDTSKKRERKPNFSDEELRCLLEGIGLEKDAINSKLQGTLTARRKKEAWDRVRTRVNAVGKGAARTHDDIVKKWRDLKSAVLKEQTYQTKTGGGGAMKETPFKDFILYIIGDRSDVVSGIEVIGTDSFIASSTLDTPIPETALENDEEDSNTSSFHRMASTSNMVDPASSQLFKMTKRSLCMPSPCIDTVISLGNSGADHQQKEDNLLSTVPGVSGCGTASKFKRKKRKQTISDTEDEQFHAWLISEIETNAEKKELIKSQIQLNEVLIETKEEKKQLIRSQIQLNEVLKETNAEKKQLIRSQIQLNEVLRQESLLRIQDIQSHNK